MPPGKITSAKPIASSSAAGRIGVLPPSTMLAISGTPGSALAMRASSSRVFGASTNSMSAPASRVARRALDRALEALDRDRIGARDDQRVGEARVSSAALILPDHLVGRDQRLAVEMAAALGEILVLELDRGRARALERAHRAHDIERVAVAGIGIDDQVRADAIADQRDRLGDLAHADEADVRAARACV